MVPTPSLLQARKLLSVVPAVVNVLVASLHANCFSSAGCMHSGLSQTSSFNFQLRVDRDQRRGLRCLASAQTASRCASTAAATPLWPCAGVTNFRPLCLCSWLYQRTNCCVQARASSTLPNGLRRKTGRYFHVRQHEAAL